MEPLEEPLCQESKVCTPFDNFYKAKGCVPVFKSGACCPSSWDCSRWESRLKQKNRCFLVSRSHPYGKFYDIGEAIEEADENCRTGCRCTPSREGVAKVTCAVHDCGQISWPKGSKCRKLFNAHRDCCASSIKCNQELADLEQCQVGDKSYAVGEIFRDPNDVCNICWCQPGWNGTTNHEFCHRQNCFADKDQKMQEGCTPVFKEGVCCPVKWICDQVGDQIGVRTGIRITKANEPSDDRTSCLMVPSTEASACEEGQTPKTGYTFDSSFRKCKKISTCDQSGVFSSEATCEKVCAAYYIDTDEGHPGCQAIDSSIKVVDRCMPVKKYRFSPAKGKCLDFSRKGCKLNEDSFASVDECEATCSPKSSNDNAYPGKTDDCNLPAQTGPCRARMPRFFYDSNTGFCRQFFYGGCQSNGNNFADEASCIEACVPAPNQARALEGEAKLDRRPRCEQDPQSGLCRARKLKYYFDPATAICKLFFYGGCGGNENRFGSLDECQRSCPAWNATRQADSLSRCEMSVVKGRCRGYFPKFFYNSTSKACQKFTYGGCEGNGNNFDSFNDCQLTCQFPLAKVLLRKIYKLCGTHEQDLSKCNIK